MSEIKNLLRHEIPGNNFAVEYFWEDISYYKNPIHVRITEKTDKKNEEGYDIYKTIEELGDINYEKNQAHNEGYKFSSKSLGEVVLKWVRKFLIVEKIGVFVNGTEIKGNQIPYLNVHTNTP